MMDHASHQAWRSRPTVTMAVRTPRSASRSVANQAIALSSSGIGSPPVEAGRPAGTR